MTRRTVLTAALLAVALLAGCQPGTADTGWDGDGVAALPSWMYDRHELAALPDGSVIVSRVVDTQTTVTGLTKLQPNGSVDTTWGVGGSFTAPMLVSGADTGPLDIGVLTDGSLIVATAFNQYESGLMKVTPQGTLDTTYGVGGRVVYSLLTTGESIGPVAIHPDGTVVEASASGPSSVTVRRYSSSGQLVSTTVVPVTFSVDVPPGVTPQLFTYPIEVATGGTDLVVAVEVQALYSSGGSLVSTDQDVAVIRLTAADAVDPTWNGGAPLNLDPGLVAGAASATSGYEDTAVDVEVQPGGGVVLAVEGYEPGTFARSDFVVRLTSGGSLDPAFGGIGIVHAVVPGTGTAMEVADIETMGTASHVTVGGRVVNGLDPDGVVLRLTSAGVPDTQFGPAHDGQITLPALVRVNDLELGAGNKVLASGPAYATQPATDVHVHRLYG